MTSENRTSAADAARELNASKAAKTLAVSALAALALTSPASAASIPDTIAPGGNIRTVVNATDRLGWPHVPQRTEMTSIARLSLYYGVQRHRASGSTRCYFGQYLGNFRCMVVRDYGRRTVITRQSWRIWEDGSYTINGKVVK